MSSSKSFFGAYAGLSVCTNYPEHISNQKRESATRSRRKLTLLSRAEMACLHSSAVPSIRWVVRPVRVIFGVFASMTGAGASEKRVTDEQQQRLDCRDLPSDGSRVAPIRGAGVKEAGRGVSRGHLPSTPRPIWVMSIASGCPVRGDQSHFRTEPKWRLSQIGKKESCELISDSTSALLVADLVRFSTWLGVRGATDGRA